MTKEISKSQIDRLGDRLKKENIDEADLRMLDQYRRSYAEAYDIVVGTIRKNLSLEPTGRPAKSTPSIAEKLRRESIRLTQIQDIAGCRIVVADIANQESAIKSLSDLFEDVTIADRRQQPSHGYRAVHLIVRCKGKLIEIQVRTEFQHLWAELSEKLSDVVDSTIKYGGGNVSIRNILSEATRLVVLQEANDRALAMLQAQFSPTENNQELVKQIVVLRGQALRLLRDAIRNVEKLKEEK